MEQLLQNLKHLIAIERAEHLFRKHDLKIIAIQPWHYRITTRNNTKGPKQVKLDIFPGKETFHCPTSGDRGSINDLYTLIDQLFQGNYGKLNSRYYFYSFVIQSLVRTSNIPDKTIYGHSCSIDRHPFEVAEEHNHHHYNDITGDGPRMTLVNFREISQEDFDIFAGKKVGLSSEMKESEMA